MHYRTFHTHRFHLVVVAVGVYNGPGNFFDSGRYHNFVPSLVSGQRENRVRRVSEGVMCSGSELD